jgi:thymidylate synthase (FAD)
MSLFDATSVVHLQEQMIYMTEHAHGVSPVVVIPPSVEMITEPNQIKKIELCARTCYKSEGRIGEGSSDKIVSSLLSKGHYAMLEHGTLSVSFPNGNLYDFYFKSDRHFIRQLPCPYRNYITLAGNFRAWIEFINAHPDSFAALAAKRVFQIRYPIIATSINTWEPDTEKYRNDIKRVIEENVRDRVTMRIITNRRVSHELVRHRVFSFAQESQRYVNYSKSGKFEIVCDPSAIVEEVRRLGIDVGEISEQDIAPAVIAELKSVAAVAADSYQRMIDAGLSQQIAAGVLTNDWKTEICMTGWLDEWRGFMRLRDAPDAHPYIRHIAKMIRGELERHGMAV